MSIWASWIDWSKILPSLAASPLAMAKSSAYWFRRAIPSLSIFNFAPAGSAPRQAFKVGNPPVALRQTLLKGVCRRKKDRVYVAMFHHQANAALSFLILPLSVQRRKYLNRDSPLGRLDWSKVFLLSRRFLIKARSGAALLPKGVPSAMALIRITLGTFAVK